MSETRERFFAQLGTTTHIGLLEGTSGTVLAEIKDGKQTEKLYVNIHHGDVTASRTGSAPDCVIRTNGATFDAILNGKLNAMAAMLRGLLEVEGNVGMLAAMQALFRPSTGAAGERAAGYARRH